MGLGKLFRATPPAPQQSRMIVSDGLRIGPSAVLGAGERPWGSSAYVQALGIPGFDRGVMLIADLLGNLPWDAYTETDEDFAEKIRPRPLLLEQPNPEETRINTVSNWTADLVQNGNAVGVIVEWDRQGTPTAVVPVPSSWVGVRRVNGETYSELPKGAIEYQIGGLPGFSADEVIHVKGPCEPGRLRGVGVLEKHFNGSGTLDLAAELGRQARSISQNGVPTAVLRSTNPDATEGDLIAVKQSWLRNMRDRTVAVLNATTEFTPLAWKPEEMQLVEARKFSLLEIANILGLPPRFLGASTGDSMTYSTSESESIDLLKFSLSGHLGRFEQTLTLQFPTSTWVQADLDAVLRADTLTRYQAYEIGIRSGFLLRSEVRQIENRRPVPGIDDKKAEPQTPSPAPADVPADQEQPQGAE
ncbi:Phage portal protein (plasmid) [Amycolatopsis sp. YIM 10]|nr:Phage portal protein [Amycolatopsis sp. YIM 10]QFU94815.1 Phage portal protein [Amycolatopsis sp. YIM 10]